MSTLRVSCFPFARSVWVGLLLITISMAAAAVAAERSQNVEVRTQQDGSLYRLRNDRVEVAVDCHSGRISSLRGLRDDQEWLTRPIFPLALALADSGDIWKAEPSTIVRPGAIKPSACAFVSTGDNGMAIEVTFDRLADRAQILSVSGCYRIGLEPRRGETLWNLELSNATDRVVVAVFYPLLYGIQKMAGAEIVRPYMAGVRTPVAKMNGPISDHYPHPLSMSFVDLSTPDHGLYLASYDTEPRSVNFSFMDTDRHGAPALHDEGWALALRRFPFIASSADWTAPTAAVMPHSGDWHAAAKSYRRFFEANFSPISMSPLLHRLSALASYHFKTPWNTNYQPGRGFDRLFDFKMSTEYRDRGIRDLRLDGWDEAGYGTFLPDFLPLRELGGEKGFARMIARANRAGLRVYPYMNVRLLNLSDAEINVNDAANAALRERCAVRRVDGSIYTEEFHHPGYGRHTGVVMCLRCAPWVDHLKRRALHLIEDIEVPGLYLDQFALGVENGLFCYDKTHGHPTPADVWGPGAVDLAQNLHGAGRARNPNFLLMIEGNFDRLYPYVDLPFSWTDESRFLPKDGSVTALEVFRYTFPNIGEQKMYSHGWSDGVAHALMTANVLDSGGHSVRLIQDQVPDVFYDGRYIDTDGIRVLSGGIDHVAGIVGASRFAIGLRGPKENAHDDIRLELDPVAMGVDDPPDRATLLFSANPQDRGRELPFEHHNRRIEITVPRSAIPAFLLFQSNSPSASSTQGLDTRDNQD